MLLLCLFFMFHEIGKLDGNSASQYSQFWLKDEHHFSSSRRRGLGERENR